MGDQRCFLCGCTLQRKAGTYARPTPEGRSHATSHHYVAERFFGRSANREGEERDRVFDECPWGLEGKSETYCYECHEELLHNPVFTPGDMALFRHLVSVRGLVEDRKRESRAKLGGRILLLHEIIAAGLAALAASASGSNAPLQAPQLTETIAKPDTE